ncbi:Period circadian protein [Dirofilaria immitis]
MVLTSWKKIFTYSPISAISTMLSHLQSCNIPNTYCSQQIFDTDPLSLIGRELKLTYQKKLRSNNNLRKCFFSPVQCLLPFDCSRSMESDNKKRIGSYD